MLTDVATLTSSPPERTTARKLENVPPAVRPQLENGQLLSRAEFERRYHAMPRLKKAELIEGEVYMGSPVRVHLHGAPHGMLVTIAGVYAASTSQVQMADNATVRLDADNEPQPDVLLRIAPQAGGRSRDTEDDYLEGPPELVIEVAGSSASVDLHKKKHAYQRSGVQEYLVWQVENGRIDWWQLVEGEYQPLGPIDGVLRSRVFPGLWIDPDALVSGDFAKALAAVNAGVASTEHAEFASKLEAAIA